MYIYSSLLNYFVRSIVSDCVIDFHQFRGTYGAWATVTALNGWVVFIASVSGDPGGE